jgi:ABC-type lipoprotein export system ATPase subunit
MIQLNNVFKSYQRGKSHVAILHDVSLQIQPNEFVAIMGPSGSGKSTLVNILHCDMAPATVDRLMVVSARSYMFARKKVPRFPFLNDFLDKKT